MMNKIDRINDYLNRVNEMNLVEIEQVNQEIEEDLKNMQSEKNKLAKETQLKNKKVAEEKAKESLKKYKYPFIIHMAGKNLETDHIFEENQEYTEDEIRTKMLEHQYYDFSGKISFDYLKNDNVLLPIFQQHKKG